jgi:hypothetical protein
MKWYLHDQIDEVTLDCDGRHRRLYECQELLYPP